MAVSKARISAFGHSLIRCTVHDAGGCILEGTSILDFSSSAGTKAFLGPTCSFRSCGDLGFRYAEKIKNSIIRIPKPGVTTHRSVVSVNCRRWWWVTNILTG